MHVYSLLTSWLYESDVLTKRDMQNIQSECVCVCVGGARGLGLGTADLINQIS